MLLLPAGVLLLQQVELVAELRVVLLKLQDFAGRLLIRGNALLQSITKLAVNSPCSLSSAGMSSRLSFSSSTKPWMNSFCLLWCLLS